MYHYRVHFLVRTKYDALNRLEDMGLVEVTDRSWYFFTLNKPNNLDISKIDFEWIDEANPLLGAILSVDTTDYMEVITAFETFGVGYNVAAEALDTYPLMLLGLWIGRERVHYDAIRKEYCVRGVRLNDEPHYFDSYDKLINYATQLGGIKFQGDPLYGWHS